MVHDNMTLSGEVREALAEGRPLVALESALITHGLAYPVNLDTARQLEATVRQGGAAPATVAMIEGRMCVGLDEAQLERLASSKEAHKCSVRDLGVAAALGWDGGTTVAATMWIAHRAGLAVFATGGIGGVHRGHPFDVSADLPELARTPLTVVCAGAKALLDLPLTLEYLETHGVPLIGYQASELPAFYSRTNPLGLCVDVRVESPQEVAAIVRARRALGLPGGELVTVPVPRAAELAYAVAERAIAQATEEAGAQGVRGAAVTPFVLARVADLTDGQSVRANLALLLNNARVAAAIACAMLG
ncbi:MAG: pseudouridine-5'-phosphate glycosidase [Thermoflexales bacterium]|nr:pseudouridine-5'-phosphate glycosidase [Thermoflexales bacterium]